MIAIAVIASKPSSLPAISLSKPSVAKSAARVDAGVNIIAKRFAPTLFTPKGGA